MPGPRHLRRRVWAVYLLLQAFSAGGAQTTWQERTTPHFAVFYLPGQARAAETLSRILEQEYEMLQLSLGLSLPTRAAVYLAGSREAFRQLTGGLVPDWGEGVADLSRNLIVLHVTGPAGDGVRVRKVVRHELTHLLVGSRTSGLPRWFHEGLAIYFSYDEEFAGGEALSKALLSGSVGRLDEIEDLLRFEREKARLAYEQSYSAVLYLEEQFGFEAIADFLKALTVTTDFERAFRDHFGLTLADFALAWYGYAEKRYRWRFLLDFETFLWIFTLLVFILAFGLIKWRNRRTLKRWEEEERLGL